MDTTCLYTEGICFRDKSDFGYFLTALTSCSDADEGKHVQILISSEQGFWSWIYWKRSCCGISLFILKFDLKMLSLHKCWKEKCQVHTIANLESTWTTLNMGDACFITFGNGVRDSALQAWYKRSMIRSGVFLVNHVNRILRVKVSYMYENM